MGWPGNPPFVNTYDIEKRKDTYLFGPRSREGMAIAKKNLGTLGGGAMHNTASPVVISDKQVFLKTSRSVVFAWEGK